MSLAEHVRTLGRGPGRSRSLGFDEANDAMTQMLAGGADPEAIGALLMLLRMKGETAEEIAAFADAAASGISGLPGVDLDWPSYAAGRTRGLAYFLLSAKLLANAGHRILLHGWNGHDGAVRAGLLIAGIDTVATPAEATKALDRNNIAYFPLESLSPALFSLLLLRDKLGLRSCINTVCRMLNPSRAAASVQGVFHPSYRLLQSDAALKLGWQNLSVIKGGGGEFERHPAKDAAVFGLRNGVPLETCLSADLDETRRLDDGTRDPARLRALWEGEIADPFAEAIVVGTAALALDTLGVENADVVAQSLWVNRQTALAA